MCPYNTKRSSYNENLTKLKVNIINKPIMNFSCQKRVFYFTPILICHYKFGDLHAIVT